MGGVLNWGGDLALSLPLGSLTIILGGCLLTSLCLCFVSYL